MQRLTLAASHGGQTLFIANQLTSLSATSVSGGLLKANQELFLEIDTNSDITVIAPSDQAFLVFFVKLGFDRGYGRDGGEERMLADLVLIYFQGVTDIEQSLRYHVITSKFTVAQLRTQISLDTLKSTPSM